MVAFETPSALTDSKSSRRPDMSFFALKPMADLASLIVLIKAAPALLFSNQLKCFKGFRTFLVFVCVKVIHRAGVQLCSWRILGGPFANVLLKGFQLNPASDFRNGEQRHPSLLTKSPFVGVVFAPHPKASLRKVKIVMLEVLLSLMLEGQAELGVVSIQLHLPPPAIEKPIWLNPRKFGSKNVLKRYSRLSLASSS
jgi:hypothetical protein